MLRSTRPIRQADSHFTADNEPHLEAVVAVLISKMIKRGIDARALDRQKLEAATHKTLRQKIKLKSGIDRESAKAIQKQIQEMGLKVRAQIQGDALRIVGAKLDDLQAVQAALRAKPPEIPIQFASDVLSNTVVQLGVRGDGFPFTARIVSGS